MKKNIVIVKGPETKEIIDALSNFFSQENKITLVLEGGESKGFMVTSFKRHSSNEVNSNEVELGLTSESGEKFKARYNTQLLCGVCTPQ